MSWIEKYYTRLIMHLLEKAQVNDWFLLEEILIFCLEQPLIIATVLIILTFLILLPRLPFALVASAFKRPLLWMMIKLAPRHVTLTKVQTAPKNALGNEKSEQQPWLHNKQQSQQPVYTEPYQQELYEILTPPADYYDNLAKRGIRIYPQQLQELEQTKKLKTLVLQDEGSRNIEHEDESEHEQLLHLAGMHLPSYQQLCYDFIRLGFEQGSLYKTKILGEVYLTPFFKQGICGYITHNSGSRQFSLIALMDNASRGLILSTEPTDKRVPRPEGFQAIVLDKQTSVDEGLTVFMQMLKKHPYKRKITPINDDNFAEYYEGFHAVFFDFLKSLNIFELKGQ